MTRRTWPLIQTLNRSGIGMAAIALVAMDATHCDTCEPFETGDDGTERVAVIGVTVQRLGVQHELPALGRGDRGYNRDLAAELVGCPGLAFADALHLGGMQRVDLGPALALLLEADPQREIEQRTKAVLECWVALDLAANDRLNPETQNARKPIPTRLSCKIQYFLSSNYSNASIASEFFTGDSLLLTLSSANSPKLLIFAASSLPIRAARAVCHFLLDRRTP